MAPLPGAQNRQFLPSQGLFWGLLKKLSDAPKPPIVMNFLGAYVRFTVTINIRA